MSAYLVEENHVAYIIEAAIKLGCTYTLTKAAGTNDIDAARLICANMLTTENQNSVNARYRETETPYIWTAEALESYHWNDSDFTAAQIIKSCDCYEYQACEHDAWEDSAAHKITQAITSRAASQTPGYDSAIWGAPETTNTNQEKMSKNQGMMDIFKDSSGDCSNSGISSRHDKVQIWEDFDTEAPDNAVVIIEDICCGKPRIRAVPANKKDKWTMFGGCCIYTCNGVVPHSGEFIALHDRIES